MKMSTSLPRIPISSSEPHYPRPGPRTACWRLAAAAALSPRSWDQRSARLLATDINPHAVRAAKARGIEVIRADLFRGIKGKFDLILFNAPYLPTEPEERTGQWIDYALDGGESGRQTVDRFIEGLAGHLRPGGRALLLISSLTGLTEVQETAKAAGFTAEVVADEGCFFERLYVLRLGTIGSSF